MLCSQMIWIQNLNETDLHAIGQIVFVQKALKEAQEKAKQASDPNKAQDGEQPEMTAYDIQKDHVLNTKIMRAVSSIYLDTIQLAKQYQEETKHVLTFTPVFYLRTFKTYKRLLEERRKNVMSIQNRYEEGLKKIKLTQHAIEAY